MTTGLVAFAHGHTSPWSRVAVVNAESMPDEVVAAFLEVVDEVCTPSAPGDPVPSFVGLCRRHSSALEAAQRLQFAVLVGALFHELQHVHDLLGTMTGSLLALHWTRTIARAETVIDQLERWTTEDSSRFVPVPITAEWLADTFPDTACAEQLTAATAELEGLRATWTRQRNTELVVPGLSIQDLFETNAYLGQLSLTAAVFGDDVAGAVSAAVEADPRASRAYTYALRVALNLMPHAPHDTAIPILIRAALDEAAPRDPSAGLPGAGRLLWSGDPDEAHGPVPLFITLARRLGEVLDSDHDPELLAPLVVEDVLERRGDPRDWVTRHRDRRTELDQVMRDAVALGLPDAPMGVGVLALLAVELPITYSDQSRVLVDPWDHDGQAGAVRCLTGEATAVSVRVHLPGGRLWTGRTRSVMGGVDDVSWIAERAARRWQVLTQPASVQDPPEIHRLREQMKNGDSEAGPRVRSVRGSRRPAPSSG